MKKILIPVLALCGFLPVSAETITAHYYGSEIDLSQKHNPCKGSTDGGVEVIVTTEVTAVTNDDSRTVIERTYSLPDGEVLRKDREVIGLPKHVVLHRLFPGNF
ncbi:MAG: hypothetical protein HDR80_03715 [Bacteroides sp.]|nr:hypothetical protein [Bacteroides sp.]